jgi:hypothetical protein
MIFWPYLEPCDVTPYKHITRFQAMTQRELKPMAKMKRWEWTHTMLASGDMIDEYLKASSGRSSTRRPSAHHFRDSRRELLPNLLAVACDSSQHLISIEPADSCSTSGASAATCGSSSWRHVASTGASGRVASSTQTRVGRPRKARHAIAQRAAQFLV